MTAIVLPSSDSPFELPPYLVLPPEGGPTYGVLRRVDTAWELVDAEPQAALLAKRLFPASAGRGAGRARFFVNKRLFGDLVWFLQRWPMQIEDRERFLQDYQETCDYVRQRHEINQAAAGTVLADPGEVFQGVLRPFQQEGLAWCLLNERMLLADDMGLGKTIQALAWLSARHNWPVLIVPPPHLMTHWERVLPVFLKTIQEGAEASPSGAEGVAYHIIKGRKNYPLPAAHIYLLHYLLLDDWRETLKGIGIDDIVFDEIQELRRSESRKYAAASDLAANAKGVLGLSGTPIYNYGGEIWNITNILEHNCLGDWGAFTREWCDGYGNDKVRDTEQLNAYLKREGLMLRRLKKDVLKDLPPKQRTVVNLDSDDSFYNKMITKAVSLATQATQTQDNYERGRLELNALNETRRVTGLAKAPAVADFLNTILEAGEPTLVFVHHHDVVDYLVDRLKAFNPRVISGRETSAEKNAALEDFKLGKTNLCFISLRAAAGLDGFQERARVVVFAELDWSPAVHAQAEDRAHRIGQLGSVLCYYLVTSVGTDLDMQEALGLKIAQFTGIMGDAAPSEEDRVLGDQASRQHMRKVLARLTAKTSRRKQAA